MTRALATLVSGLLLTAGAQTETPPEPSRWVHNARERTDSGIRSHEQGEVEVAGEAFGTALALAPADPLVQFNAGTASLLGADPEAVPLLQAAAESAPAPLQPTVFYNLGNALMAGQDFPAAIESYKQSLRLRPDSLDAKHNLELAQRMLEQQQRQQEQERNEDQDESENQPEKDQQEQPQDQQQQPQEQEQQPSDSPLPDFDEQPDMTAEQAAAILEAVENLEREQRQKQALEQMKQAKKERDW